MTADESSCGIWSREQDKAFENALATHPQDCLDRWEKIAAQVPGKSVDEVMYHYQLLVEDLSHIESGCVPLPCYSPNELTSHVGDDGTGKSDSNHGGKSSRSNQERRKGIAWTEDEHRLFLLGLDKHGKGDWRNISRNFVVTRTPTQVASHAQKYFIRLNSMKKDKRRSSIHDITNVCRRDVQLVQGQITSQMTGAAAGGLSTKTNKPPPQSHAAAAPGVGLYGSTIAQPAGGPLVCHAGTPMNLPSAAHMVYGVRPPMARPVVPGAQMGMSSIGYPMPPASAYR